MFNVSRNNKRLAAPNRTLFGRLFAWSLKWFDRLVAVDFVLFTVAMVWKLYFFSTLLSVQYMDMTRTDKIIETGAVLLLACWTLLLPTRGRLLALIALNLILSFLLYSDVIYYRYFQDLITVPVLLQLGQVESLGGSISSLLSAYDFWLFADMIFILPYAVFVIWKGRKTLREAKSARQLSWVKPLARIGSGLAAFAIGFMLFAVNLNNATDTWAKGLFEKNYWNLTIYNVAGGLGFHGYDIYRYAKVNWFGAETVTAEQKSETEQWIEELGNRRGRLESDPLFGAYAGSNVLMVQVESLQSFMIGASIGGREITPVLNDLIKESAYFDNFYHQTAQGRTSDADFATSCSMQPLKSGSVFIQYASHDFDCLPETLKNNGYSANVFHPYQGGFWNRNVMYGHMDYDQFYSLKHFELDERLGWALGDKSFYRQSMDYIAKRDAGVPFYAFLISLTSHHPYKLPKASQKLDVEELEGTMMGDYLQSVHYADAALGELIARMKADGLWENTIFALYGDHDSSITDWSLYDRFIDDTASPLAQEQTIKKVPFLIHLPDGAYAGSRDTVGGQLDTTPTLLHLLGISSSRSYMLGMPLLTASDDTKRLVVQRDGSWTDGEMHYLPSEDGLPANGRCYKNADGSLLDTASCAAKTAEAELQLMMSDRIVMGDLLPAFKKNGAVEAIQMSGEK
ncbi:LTA synthase family protein [Paenibacillus sp. LHD-117]|uniref:LTA synthase family protein n=1 Tax=Paenibacillus sp. LHD-117 TaxID=3071412 RepID=UPI0027DED2B5|nr:LTA synthase family protein [Paenibacillus sp. LHD-117]MDQ6421833.1 LTA synthase family protein [Paenibacillus sp. LHD-117]